MDDPMKTQLAPTEVAPETFLIHDHQGEGESPVVVALNSMVIRAAEPVVVLLDEPLTGLDRELHDQLAVDLAAMLRDARATALLVTHDHDEADTIADRTVQLADL